MNTAETAILSEFWQKNGLGPLGVKAKETSFALCSTTFLASNLHNL